MKRSLREADRPKGERWTIMRVGQWVLYYPDDNDMGRRYQVKIMCWADRRGAVHVRYPSGHEEEVPAYRVRAGLACM